MLLCSDLSYYPPHLSAAQSKERAPARDYATASALAGRPRAPSRAPQQPARSAADAPSARTSNAVLRLWAKLRGEPPAPPSFGNATLKALHSQAEWGHGVGRHARQMRGEIVSTCKELRVRSRSLRVQTGLYRSLYPIDGDLPFPFKKTHGPCVNMYWSILGARSFPNGVAVRTIDWNSRPLVLVSKAPLACVRSPSALCQKPHPSGTRDEAFSCALLNR